MHDPYEREDRAPTEPAKPRSVQRDGYAAPGWTDERITAVKREINCLVFEWADEQMTLREAEEVACEMLTAILKTRRGAGAA